MALYSSHTDAQLLGLLKTGDGGAFTEIYNRYHQPIYVYLIDFVKVPSLAEDLVHEVFMKIWEIRTRLEIKRSFSAYIYRISHNKALDALRKIASDQALRKEVLQWIDPHLPESDYAAIHTRRYERLLEEAVATLPAQRQKVFILCREEGKTYDEAASALGISRNTVKEHMVQSLRFLRHYFYEKGKLTLILLLVEKLF